MHHCNQGHLLKVLNGTCAECNRERQARHRENNRAARALFKALEGQGVPPDVERIIEGHRLLTAMDLARDPAIRG